MEDEDCDKGRSENIDAGNSESTANASALDLGNSNVCIVPGNSSMSRDDCVETGSNTKHWIYKRISAMETELKLEMGESAVEHIQARLRESLRISGTGFTKGTFIKRPTKSPLDLYES